MVDKYLDKMSKEKKIINIAGKIIKTLWKREGRLNISGFVTNILIVLKLLPIISLQDQKLNSF